MTRSKILITGASGCVGQYISAWLLNNSEADLFLWLRDPRKLKSISIDNPRIKLLIGDLRNSDEFANEISETTHLIHTATAWGDPIRAEQVNIDAVKDLINLLDEDKIQRIIYFSTASILDENLNVLQESYQHGTEYIKTKAICLHQLESHRLASKIIAVFPTLVFGGKLDGSDEFPTSYLTQGLKEVKNWLWLARWFKIDSSFHFIHAADIACICGNLVTNRSDLGCSVQTKNLKRIVLGQPHTTINKSINILCEWNGVRAVPKIPLWGWLIKALIKVLPIQLSPWDKFSIEKRHFTHFLTATPEELGKRSFARDLKEILLLSGLGKKNKQLDARINRES